MELFDFIKDFTNNLGGSTLGGDYFMNYDKEHADKMEELLDIDDRYVCLVEKEVGIDPYEDDYDGPDNDIRIINNNHCAIKAELKGKANELLKKVYDAIDKVYAEKDTIDLDDELDY